MSVLLILFYICFQRMILMRKFLRHTVLVTILSTIVLSGVAGVYANQKADHSLDSLTLVSEKTESSQLHILEQASHQKESNARVSSGRSFFPTWFSQSFRSNEQMQNEKLLSNVKVFPNPTAESINLSFNMGKRSDVSIKVMDALGNELITLLNQALEEGSQNHSFDIQGRLKSGLYFVRLSVGTETVVKRVSVL